MNVGVIGAGLIGKRRAEVAASTPGVKLSMIADVQLEQAENLAAKFGAEAVAKWEQVVARPDIQTVIVSTPNHLLCPIAQAAVEQGKHVLVEKPLGRNPEEAQELVAAARSNNVLVKAGFNHRYHPAVEKAWQIASSGRIGELIFIRGRYGHGGRAGYNREWRCDPEKSGGGELLDQGIHLIDLARWFLGDFKETIGFTSTGFWPIAPVEDNAFALLKTAKGQVASLHASWTQWKNLFSWEVYGTEGSVTVEGLGGSYGPERLILAQRRAAFGPPDLSEEIFSGSDFSWQKEWEEFIQAIRHGAPLMATGEDGLAALRIAYAIYGSNWYNVLHTKGEK